MDCVKRRLLIRQLAQHHQLLHNCADDCDNNDGLTSCWFFLDIFNFHKSTIGQKIVGFFKENTKKRLNRVVFESCFRQNKETTKSTKEVLVNKRQIYPFNNILPHRYHHRNLHQYHHRHRRRHHHHLERKAKTSKRCILSGMDISCSDFIKVMTHHLKIHQLIQLIQCIQQTRNSCDNETRRSLSSPPSSSSSSSSPSSSSPPHWKSRCIVIPKNIFFPARLAGADPGMVSCLLFMRSDDDDVLGRGVGCKMGNWGELRRLPMCTGVEEDGREGDCINPCHWSRVKDHESTSSGTRSATRKWKEPWCQTIQRSFYGSNPIKTRVSQSWTEINFSSHPIKIPQENMCICQKVLSSESSPQDNLKTIVLEKTGNEVFLHNLSNVPVFIRSSTIENTSFGSSVLRLEPSTCALIYNACIIDQSVEFNLRSGDVSPLKSTLLDSVLVSFGKGWGLNYRRSSILDCPSWMEILLARI